MKHIKSIILTLLTALLTLPASAQDFTYDGLIYEVLNQDSHTCKTKTGNPYAEEPGNTAEGDLMIPSTVSDGSVDYTVVEIGDDSFKFLTNLTSVTLPETIQRIGYRAFEHCEGLISINFPNSITVIEENAFNTCSSLSDASLSENLANLGKGAFANCSALTRVVLPSKLTYIDEYTFDTCESLKTIVFNEGLEEIGVSAFSKIAVETLELPESLTKIDDWAFASSANLVTVVLPSNLTKLGFCAFDQCRKLKTINFPQSITTIDNGVFRWCDSLESVELPDDVTSLSGVFEECISLKSVKLPNKLEYLGGLTFARCTNLASIDFPESLTTIDSAFADCRGLTNVSLPESLTKLEGEAFAFCGELKSVTIPASLQSLSRGAFDGDDIETLDYLASTPLEASEDSFNEWSFQNTILNMPNATLADVQATTPWNKFVHIVAKDGSVGSSLAVGDDFEYEGILYTVLDAEAKTVRTKEGHIENGQGVPGNNYIGDLVIPAIVSDGSSEYSVIEIGVHGFTAVTGITSVVLPETVASIQDCAFEGCSNLASVTIPESVTLIDVKAFDECVSLTIVNLPDGLIYLADGAFSNCSSVTSIVIPESVKYLGTSAFGGCSNLRSVVIPASIEEIGVNAFWGCNANIELTYNATSPITAPDICEDLYPTAILNTPNATLADVQATTPWNKFAHIIAKDGSVTPALAAGDDFEYEGILYTVLDPEAKTCKTKVGRSSGNQGYEGDITIPTTVSDGIDNYTVIEIGNYSFYGCSNLSSLELPNTVTSIGDGSFYDCSGLSSIVLSNTLLSIGHASFAGCSSLTSIDPPNTLTYIGGYAFASCINLTSIELPDALTAIEERTFLACRSLESLIIPESVTSIGLAAFDNCNSLKSIKLPYLITTIEDRTFASCSNLTSIELPNSLTSIGDYSFSNCFVLASIELPTSLKTIGSKSFMGCSSLASLTIPESVTSIGEEAFLSCTGFKSVILPASITSIGNSAFSECINIEGVEYKATSLIEASERIFENAIYSSATLNTPNATLSDVQTTTPWNKFAHIVAKDGSIGEVAAGDEFEYEGLWYTVIDPEAKTVKTKDGDMSSGEYIAGNQCEGALTIPSTVSDGNQDYTVIELGIASFTGNDITSVTLPETLNSLGGWAFLNCENLQSINIPSSVSKIDWGTFSNCKSLASIEIPDNIVELEGWAFNGCSALASVKIPASQTVLEENVFSGCSSLTSITLPEVLTEIKNGVFNGCSSLQSISFPSTLTSIGDIAFASCSGLTSVVLPESLKSLAESVFIGCSNIQSVIIPAGIEEIGENAFGGCNSDMELTYNAASLITAPDICNEEMYSTATLNTPNATLADVQATEPWNKFAHIVASDGSIGEVAAGDEFEYEGIMYTVIDPEAKTVKTKDGHYEDSTLFGGNSFEGDLVIPSMVSIEGQEYSVIEIGRYGFANAVGLTSVSIPESIPSIPERAFGGCSNLASVTIPESVTLIDVYAFSECGMLTDVKLPEALESIGYNAFGGCSSLTSIVIPESLKSLGMSVFDSCSNLRSVVIPASIEEIGVNAFWGCNANIELTYNATSPITAPDICEDLYPTAILNTPNATLASVQATEPWNKFAHIVAKDGSVGSSLAVGDDFYYEGLWYTVLDAEAKTVKTKEGHIENEQVVPGNNYNGDLVIPAIVSDGSSEYSVKEIGRSGFENAVGLTSIRIPDPITSIPAGAFNGCSNLTSVTIPESVTLIDVYAFFGCGMLTDVKLPEALESLGYSAFLNCSSLTSIVIPEKVVSLGNQCLAGCSSLKVIDIPASVEFFDYGVFLNCSADALVTYRAENPVAVSEDLFSASTYNNGTLNTPNATLAAVRASEPWNKFLRIEASDGSIGILHAGDSFESDGIIYTVISEEDFTLQTKSGEDGIPGNTADGNIVIPETVEAFDQVYTVIEIGNSGFSGNDQLLSVTIPATVENIAPDAFADCERLTSLVWQGHTPLPGGVIEGIGNPNLLIYVDSVKFAPAGLDRNIVADGTCENLVLTPAYPFLPLMPFTAEHSEITKSFTQQTPLEGCAGWETLTIPFEPTSVTAPDGRALVPFANLTDIDTECPFWLYEADPAGEWKEASAIHRGIPYLVSMPNNEDYDEQYRIDGDVTFSTDMAVDITAEICSPYATTWASGREFRSLWLPLTDAEADNALGLNVGISDLTDDEGQLLLPGSAFHADVLPLPLEAYVTRIDSRRMMPVRGAQSFVRIMNAENGLRVAVDFGSIILSSDRDRTVDILTMDGIVIRRANLKAGETYRIDHLTRGIYLVAGRKITVK